MWFNFSDQLKTDIFINMQWLYNVRCDIKDFKLFLCMYIKKHKKYKLKILSNKSRTPKL